MKRILKYQFLSYNVVLAYVRVSQMHSFAVKSTVILQLYYLTLIAGYFKCETSGIYCAMRHFTISCRIISQLNCFSI